MSVAIEQTSLPPSPEPTPGAWRAFLPSRQRLPLLATLVVLVLMYVAACLRYDNFFTAQVAANLIGDNAFLGVAAVGITFVIIAGGIDLSVGSAIGATSVMIASLVEVHGWPPAAAIAAALALGIAVGVAHGALIAVFDLQPFLVTLGGLFFYRGVGLLVSRESIPLNHEQYVAMSGWVLNVREGLDIPLATLIFVGLLAIATYFAAFRPVGRAVYALGGNEQSALLMGLPVRRIKIGVYAFSGFCAALAGVTASIYTSSGTALTGAGLELDAIAAVVIGGTLLSGGVGGPIGTLLGILIFGIIQTAINFEGTLSSWWARIVVGLLLLAFIVFQTLLQPRESHA